jgi:hypothetical protein
MQNVFEAVSQPTPKPDAPSVRAMKVAADIEQHAVLTMRTHIQQLNNGMLAFWQNPAATPQQIAEALGTKAAAIFAEHSAAVAALVARHPFLTLVPADEVKDGGAHQLIVPPAWAEITPEVVDGQPTGRVVIAEKQAQ